MSDPAASADLDELIAMNIAGDIEAAADGLDDALARLRRIAAGVRALDTDRGSRGAPHGNVGDGPFMSVPTPRDPQHEGEDL